MDILKKNCVILIEETQKQNKEKLEDINKKY